MSSTLIGNLKKFGFKSVFFSYLKNTTFLVFVVFIPVTVIMLLYYEYNYYENLNHLSKVQVQKSTELLDTLLYPFDMGFQSMRTNSNTAEFLSVDNSSMGDHHNLQQSLRAIVEESEFILSAEIFSFSNFLVASPQAIVDSEYILNHMPMHWYTVYTISKCNFLIFPRKRGSSEHFNTLYIAKEIITENHIKGVFCLEIDYSYFEDIINRTFPENTNQIYVLSNIGLILYSSHEPYINKALFSIDTALWDDYNSVLQAQDQLVIDRTNVSFVSMSKDQEINVFIKTTEKDQQLKSPFDPVFFICFALILLFTSLIISLLISLKMYRSIISLVNIINFPQKSNPHFSNLGEYLAIGDQLANSYLMNKEMNTELQENLQKMKNAQKVALQSQINPHFIFNTLQIVNLSILAEVGHDNESIRIVNLLAELIRPTYESTHYFITVREEIDYTEKYLEILKIRYKNRLFVMLDVPKDTWERKTVKLLCQPLIENSFKHAFITQNSRWEIYVRCRCDEKFLYFEIQDNGIGISPETLGRLNNSFAAQDSQFSDHIGLSNTNSRLKLLFGNNYSMRIESEPGHTVIYIRHPFIS